jgi:hypothetical protein
MLVLLIYAEVVALRRIDDRYLNLVWWLVFIEEDICRLVSGV